MSSSPPSMVVIKFPDGTSEKFRPGKTAAEVIKGCSRDVRALKDRDGITLTPDDVCAAGVYEAVLPALAGGASNSEYMNAKLKADMAALKGSNAQRLRQAAAEAAREKHALHETVTQQEVTLQEMEAQLRSMEEELKRAAEEEKRRRMLLSEQEKRKQTDEAELKRLADLAREEELKRRHLHNMIQDMKGSVRVYVRFADATSSPDSSGAGPTSRDVPFKEVIGSEDKAVAFTPPLQETSSSFLLPKKTREFEFTRVFWPRHVQGDVFQEVHELVQSALDGQDVAILGYGPSGTGKTHTLLGPIDYSDYAEDRGLIPRAVQQLFTHYEELQRKNWRYNFKLCCIEMDNNNIRDLLKGGATLANGQPAPHRPPSSDDPEHVRPTAEKEKKHDVYEHKGKGGGNETHIAGVTVVPLAQYKDLKPLLQHAWRSFTSSGSSASRRHFVLQVRIMGQHDSGLYSHGTLNVVDLAPSDSTSARDPDAVALTEIVAAVSKGASEIPYRKRVLTHMLQDCFSSKAKMLVFLTASLDMARALPSYDALVYGENLYKLGMMRNETDRRKSRARTRRGGNSDMHMVVTQISSADPLVGGLPMRRSPVHHRSRSIAVDPSRVSLAGKLAALSGKSGTLRSSLPGGSSTQAPSTDAGGEKKKISNSASANALAFRRTPSYGAMQRSKSKPRENTSSVRLTIGGARQPNATRRDSSTVSLHRRESQSSITSGTSAGSTSPRRHLSPQRGTHSDAMTDIVPPEVNAWVRSLIGKKIRSARRDLANGVVFAELLAKRFPKEVGNVQGYSIGSSTEKRTENWERLQKVFSQIGFAGPSNATMQDIIDAKHGAAVLTLQKIYEFMRSK